MGTSDRLVELDASGGRELEEEVEDDDCGRLEEEDGLEEHILR